MNNLKGKVSLLLAVIMITLTILPMVVSAATVEELPVSMIIKDEDGNTLKSGTTYTFNCGDKIIATASCLDSMSVSWSQNSEYCSLKGFKVNSKGMAILAYLWDNESVSSAKISSDPTKLTVEIPSTFKAGSTHTLLFQAVGAADNYTPAGSNTTYTSTTGWVKIKFTISAENVIEDIDDELVIEPWMKESKELEELSVSLRNDSEENDKSNKNIYALGEEVVYYVDYKNGDSKIKKSVKLVLELPLDVTVVDAFGGVVDGKTITWTFPDGLEEDECGTKVVVVKYNSLGKAREKSKIVYPVADIYSNSKLIDSSSVINLIFKDEDTEITNDEHYPYMFGDEDSTTFRPNDGITRAEAALVLTRIFGMNTSGVVVRNVYSDLGETYVEAQKAIIAATDAGLVNGYSDKTYRPNENMTRAEFMKIIAANIELVAEDDDIRGLNVKESSEEIKIYKNPVKSYVANGQVVTEHWASPYVTMLARLNMTDLTSKNKDLRLDEEITRAEVAQLVNFYLFRAPAEVSSKTKSGFSDVTKSHKLFADIIEATRDAHTYTLTVEGKEVAIDD